MSVLVWVPAASVADALRDVAGVDVEVVDPGELTDLPDSVADVEFYVPSFFPSPPGLAAMAKMPRLKVVQTLTAGVDKLRPLVPPGVTLCNARGAHDASTAEWVVAAILASRRDFPAFARATSWDYHFTSTLAESTVLIVGYGSIGLATERRLAGFEVDVLRVARRPRPAEDVHGIGELSSLLGQADVVVLLVPVTPETTGMVDADFLAKMKDGALLVNAARGSIVDTSALVAEVTSGRLRAAMDVTDPEPLPPGHPLWTAPGVLITPHVAASTALSMHRAAALVRSQVAAYQSGTPLANVITDTY
jgi:phosphoglycerate dehydrogenase-like enzyme